MSLPDHPGMPGAAAPLPLRIWRLDIHGEPVHGSPPFADQLSPGCRALWDLTVWPTLKRRGVADEVALELGAAREPVLTYWRHVPPHTEAGEGHYIGVSVPGRERQALLKRLHLAQRSLDTMPGAVLRLSLRHDVLCIDYAGGNLLDLVGVTPDQVTEAPALLLSALDSTGREALHRAVSYGPEERRQHFNVLVRATRTQRVVQVSGSRAFTGDPWDCVLTDVSEREQLLAELRQVAETDHLTRLPNRRGLLLQIQQRLALGRPFAVLFLNGDRFKQVNSGLGHPVGDVLLRQVGERLRQALREGDELTAWEERAVAARHGGDEFVLLADAEDGEPGAQALAARLVRTMAQPYPVGDFEVVLTVSCGLALADADSTAEQLLRDAGTAMHEAKRSGRNRWVTFRPAMQERAASAMRMEARLRQALSDDQVVPHFQPIACVWTGRVHGLEALARWHDPVLGTVSPVQFIAVAEESGQIGRLSEQVMRRACRHFVQWQRDGLLERQRLSVNLSRAQLVDRSLPRRLLDLVGEAGLDPELLQLEITESMAMLDDSEHDVLAELRAAGFRLSLDDFGTGHSSLAVLNTLPVHQVKLDRSFVRELATSAYHGAVIQAALHVADALGLEVVAEGVEHEDQARRLASLGCTRAQGWLYGRPVPADEVPALLHRQRPLVGLLPAADGPVDRRAP